MTVVQLRFTSAVYQRLNEAALLYFQQAVVLLKVTLRTPDVTS